MNFGDGNYLLTKILKICLKIPIMYLPLHPENLKKQLFLSLVSKDL